MISQVFIVGAGIMGQGIAQVTITAGLPVILYDLDASKTQAACHQIEWSLNKLSTKGRLAGKPSGILSKLQTTTDFGELRNADLIIEAVPEIEELKRQIISKLDSLCPPEAIFASNTSAIPIERLAKATSRPEHVCGLHFFNPVPLMPLVEIATGENTSAECLSKVTQFVEKIGKQPVFVKGEQPGFIVNRILGAAMIEAMRILESGHASAGDIDKAMRLGCGWKMGPLATADLAGLDTVLKMCEVMQAENNDQVFAPPQTLRKLVASGHLGKKTGSGFFESP